MDFDRALLRLEGERGTYCAFRRSICCTGFVMRLRPPAACKLAGVAYSWQAECSPPQAYSSRRDQVVNWAVLRASVRGQD
jgi:hypothetical protein